MFSPLRPGMVWNVLLDVVAADVVNFDACRSSDELAPPEAAMTAAGMASSPAAATIGTIIFRMTTSRYPLARTAGQLPGDRGLSRRQDPECMQTGRSPCEDRVRTGGPGRAASAELGEGLGQRGEHRGVVRRREDDDRQIQALVPERGHGVRDGSRVTVGAQPDVAGQ